MLYVYLFFLRKWKRYKFFADFGKQPYLYRVFQIEDRYARFCSFTRPHPLFYP